MRTRTISDQDKVKSVIEFLSLGFKDYLGARVLLMEGLCLQGAQLASTAVEKYLKAIMALRGNSTTKHLSSALFNSVRQYDPKLMQTINQSFLGLLVKVYSVRYLDNIKLGNNFAIASTNLLAELDFTVAELQKRFVLTRSSSEETVPMAYASALARKDQRLLRLNYLLSGEDKKTFLEAHPPHCYEMRVFDRRGLMEVEYDAAQGRIDDNFTKAALVPGTPAGA